MKKVLTLITLTIVIAIYGSLAFAAFKDCGWGTRPAGMGGAFVGVANDSNAPLWNPAGIAQMKRAEGSFMYAQLYTGLDLKAGNDTVNLGYNYLSFVYPKTAIGAFGISWANFTASNLYKEDTFTLTYAKRLNDWIPRLMPKVYLGLNLKSLGHTYTLDDRTKDDAVFASGNSKNAFTVDIGALVKPIDRFAIGLSAKNLTQPDVGLKDADKVPMEIKAGVAYRYTAITPAVDITYRDKDMRFHIGVESWLMSKMLGLRAGFNSTEATFGFSFNGLRSQNLGLNLDYSFIFPLQIEDSSGSHRVSVGVWF